MTTILCTLNNASLPISQLEQVEKLSSNDLFVVERLDEIADKQIIFQENHNAQEDVEEIVDAILLELGTPRSTRDVLFDELKGEILGYVHSNGKISYEQLSSRIFKDLSCAFNFNTMAFRNDWEYSLVGHQHEDQYSDTRVFPRYAPDEMFQIGADLKTIASWNVDFCSMASIEQIANSMKNMGANTYCLQNIRKNQLEELRSRLGRTWKMVFAKQKDHQEGEEGVGILYYSDNLLDSWSFVVEPQLEDGVGIIQVLKFEKFYIANVNFSSSGIMQQKFEQIEFILDKLDSFEKDRPMWLCGSFNYSPNSSIMKKIKEKFTIVSKIDSSTVSTEDDFVADYILLDNDHIKSKNIKCTAKTLIEASSSHYPINVLVNDISEWWIGDFIVWQLSSGNYISSNVGIYIPPIKFEKYFGPDVGEIRFMGWKDIPRSIDEKSPLHISSYNETTLIADDSTSGWWCYCNGQKIECGTDNFMDACEFFAGNRKAQSFNVPCLSNFIVPNPRKDLDDPMKFVLFENGLAEHSHQIIQPSSSENFSLKGKIIIDADTYGGFAGDSSRVLEYIHSGGAKKEIDNNSFMKQIEISLSDTKVDLTTAGGETLEIGDDKETKPASNSLVALVYLGEF